MLLVQRRNILISSASMIGAVMVIRRVAAAMLRRDFDGLRAELSSA
jgi:hypothetical protein